MKLSKTKIKYIFLEKCDSTNSYLKREIQNFKPDKPIMVAAREQISGRGRYNRKWYSKKNKGLYCSMGFVFNKEFPINLLSLATGVAVIDLLNETFKDDYYLKWPNDIYLSKKKIAGILIENSLYTTKIFSIIGVGINVNHSPDDFVEHLKSRAVSLNILDSKQNIDSLIKKFANILLKSIENLEVADSAQLIKRCNYFSRSFINKEIEFTVSGEKRVKGIFLGITEDGGLKLKLSGKNEKIFYSGEIVDLHK